MSSSWLCMVCGHIEAGRMCHIAFSDTLSTWSVIAETSRSPVRRRDGIITNCDVLTQVNAPGRLKSTNFKTFHRLTSLSSKTGARMTDRWKVINETLKRQKLRVATRPPSDVTGTKSTRIMACMSMIISIKNLQNSTSLAWSRVPASVDLLLIHLFYFI